MKYGKTFYLSLCLMAWAALIFAPLDADAAKANGKAKLSKAASQELFSQPNAFFDVNKMSDMSDFDPANPVVPKGDTIKIAIVASFSGPGALNGSLYWAPVQWAAHDINKRGGILVDGKRKLVEVIRADHMSKPDQCKKVVERLILQEKVQFLWGTNGSHLMKIINETANKYKVISMSAASVADDLQDATNFGRYSFMASCSTEQIGRGLAYYYGQIKKKEKKFYILCQDYGFGREIANGFKKGLKEYYPEAKLVGEDYHKLFLTDFAPYLTKIQASGAEVIFTGDWIPDAENLLKQSRQMGINLPFANLFMVDATMLNAVGVEGTKGLVNINMYDVPPPAFRTAESIKFYRAWNNQWKTWKAMPFNGPLFEHPTNVLGSYNQLTYWLLSVIERAGSTDPEKIIKVWEGDTYKFANGKIIKMRICDHKAIQNFTVSEYVPPDQQNVSFNIPPYYWYKNASNMGPGSLIPAAKVLPLMDKNLDRCKGKSDWGE
jgi:branched-chain amino acid transport system substrate-binding protein